MAVLLHVLIALLSIGYSAYLFISPSRAKLNISYILVAMTLASGTYLVLSTGAAILPACLSGILYTGFVLAVIGLARRKLAQANTT